MTNIESEQFPLPNAIAAFRNAKSLTITRLAAKVGISAQMLHEIETRRKAAPAFVALKVCQVLEKNLDEVFPAIKPILFRILRVFGYFGYAPPHDAVWNSQEAAMTTLSPSHLLPTSEEVAIARESGRALSAFLQTRAETQQIEIFDDKGASHPVRVPVSALRLLVDVLTEIGEGNAVSIIPIHAELTTQAAADVLNVSRPFLVQLLERGEIPFHKIGTHRRVRYQDVIAYKERIDAERSKALDALAEQAQALKMGYE